jgi:DNA-binding SARP family transcriptional activator/tetratricopeptide (TPR) repeat protein
MPPKLNVMQVRLLGPVDVVVGGEARAVPGLRRKAVLAVLALQHGQIVSRARLAALSWGEPVPPNAGKTLQVHVSYLRGVLGGKTAIRARPPGYVLDLGEDGTDVLRAQRLLGQGGRADDPGQGVARLREALSLWRGQALADITGLDWLEEQAGQLEKLRLRVEVALAQARLAAGEHEALLPDLDRLAAGHPLDEPIHAHLMLALHRSGRQAEALAAYQRLRHALSAELGIDPGQGLRDLQAAILRQDPALNVPVTRTTPAQGASARGTSAPGTSARERWADERAGLPVPAQLPPAVSGFAGRAAELASLDGLARPGQDAPATVVISAVSGSAGVGKTALAVHWAHRVRADFPDGQLYVNLRGFDPGGIPVAPAVALRGFLDALGISPERIPQSLDSQVALYRSLVAGRRVLVVLDNAREAGQVRPLLPGSPGCLAIVTSRNQLTSLAAAEGARLLTLDLLPYADARALLAQRLGTARVSREPAAADEIIGGCARLPLALAIATARAAAAPGFPLAAVAASLREAARALDPFEGGDIATNLRAVFSWSSGAVSDDAARLFRLLGLHPGPDIAVAAAASLAGLPLGQARGQLAELARAHLLTEHVPGRYSCHDLLRAFAAEQALAVESEQDRDEAVSRVLDHYLHTANRAAFLLEPYPLPLAPARAGVTASAVTTEEEALGWFTTEHAALLAAVRLAARARLDVRAWQLAATLTPYQLRGALWAEQASASQAGLDAARSAGDAAGQAHSLLGLALGYARSGRFAEAAPLFDDALRLFGLAGDPLWEGRVQGSLAWLAERDQRPADALDRAMRSLELFTAAGHPAGQAMALNDIGYCHALLGDYQRSIAYCERALAAFRDAGNRDWEAATWDSLGYAHCQLGDYGRAIECYEHSAAMYADLADRFNEADTLDHLGDAKQGAGDAPAAADTWARALRILDDIGHPDAARVRAKLSPAAPGPTTPGPAAPGVASPEPAAVGPVAEVPGIG